MQHIKRMLYIITLSSVLIIIGLSCDQPTEVEDDDICENNTQSYLGEIFYADKDGPYFSTEEDPIVLSEGDVLQVSYEFVDYECNLSGGKAYLKLNDWDSEWNKVQAVALSDDMPCSNNEEGFEKAGIDLYFGSGNPDNFEGSIEYRYSGLDDGDYSFDIILLDNCNIRSNTITGYFRYDNSSS